MTNDDQVAQLFAHANPVPSLDWLTEADQVDIGTDTNLEGSRGMITTTTKHEKAPRPKRSLIAAAVAGVVIVAVALPLLLTNGNDADVASSPETVAQSFIDGVISLDAQPLEGLLSEDATAMYLDTFGYNEEQPGSVSGLWEWGNIYGMTYTSEGCRASNNTGGPSPSDPPADGRVSFFTCDYQMENDWIKALDQPPMTGRFRMEIADGRIVWLVEDFPFAEFETAWGMVIEWVQTEHPDDFETMFLNGPPGAGLAESGKLTPESMALWRQYNQQIVSALSDNAQ
jgi:hypothetical protein